MKILEYLGGLWLCAIISQAASAQSTTGARQTVSLNGTWQFEQTLTAAPPTQFSRHIPVPGLIHLAEPKIADYDAFFKKPERVRYQAQHNVEDRNYVPKYSWYRRTFPVSAAQLQQAAVLTIKKSQYVTRVFINGFDAGSSIECFTPIEFPIGRYLKAGDNEVLVSVGDRAWLPSEAAGGTDKEKVTYLPGIWDDVSVSFTRNFRVSRALLLPNLKENKVTAKLLLRSFYPPQQLFGTSIFDSCRVQVDIRETKSGKPVAQAGKTVVVRRDNQTEVAVDVPFANAHLWTPDDPFRYTATVRLLERGQPSDAVDQVFGMREFGRQGKYFTLNGQRLILRGTNINLHRFLEDPEARALPWDRAWVKKLLIDGPKATHWNIMRTSVGLFPDFWYDLADEYGMMFQDEWLYWQNHGWDEEIRREYTNWVWSDGNHPSIVIWDGINENHDKYIGTQLIPELKKLDPTRIWDAGYMTAEEGTGAQDDMDEPHPYVDVSQAPNYADFRTKHPYNLGLLHDTVGGWTKRFRDSPQPQLVNEYGWMWLWRDGRPSKLTVPNYDFYLGPNSAPAANRELQAYWLQLQTEWLRAERSLAGVMHFTYLTNNYGFTGDSFVGPIAELNPSPMQRWFRHCFAPQAVFLNFTDERYMKHVPPHAPGAAFPVVLTGVNDLAQEARGTVRLRLLDAQGHAVLTQTQSMRIPAYGEQEAPVTLTLPKSAGGYLLLAEFTPAGARQPVISRRYVRVGPARPTQWYDMPATS